MKIRNDRNIKSSLSHEELIKFSHDIAKQIIAEKISQDEAVDMIMEKMNCNRNYANGLLMRWVLNEPTYNGMVMTNSRRPIKSGIYDECIGESTDGTYSIYKNDTDKVFMFAENGRVTKEVDYNDDEVDGVLENWIEIYDVKIKPQYKNFVYSSRKIASSQEPLYWGDLSGDGAVNVYTREEYIEKFGEEPNESDKLDEEQTKTWSSRKPVKSSVRWDDDNYIVETFEEYGNGEFYVTDKSNPRNVKTFYSEKDAIQYVRDKSLEKIESSHKITSARYIATDPETGEVLGSADTYEEAVNEWGEDVTITDSEASEGQEDMELFQSRKISSAVDGGWEVRTSDVPKALDLFVEYFGEEDALEQIAKAMGDNTLEENIDWIAQQWGFAEDIEELNDAWDKYETAKEIMGESELFNNLTQAAGYDELAEDLAFIFRMNDFREWDEVSGYEDEYEDDDEEYSDFEEKEDITSNRSFPVKTVKNILSGKWSEDYAAECIAQKQDINVGYAKQILSSWIEQYKPKLIKSGILDIAEDINTEFDIDGDLESWAEQYTNDSGKANTVGGEMVRAAMQIIGRYNGDGDMIGRGYGNESVNPAARYIIEKAEMGVNEQIQKWLDHEERADDYDYDDFIQTFTSEIEQILRENPELFQKPNKDDYWSWKIDDDLNYGFDECYITDSNGNEYWFQQNGGDVWNCTSIETSQATYSEGDTINDGDEYSDEIDRTEEFGSFEAEGFIFEYNGIDWNDETEQYSSWQITKVIPNKPFCDEGDNLGYYDLEPDSLDGFTLFDHNGNEIDERTFLANSLIKSVLTSDTETVIEIMKDGRWEFVSLDNTPEGWSTNKQAKVFPTEEKARSSALVTRLENAGYSEDTGNLKFSHYSKEDY